MFVKITKSKDKKYVQIVKSYRENGKVKHKIVLNLGRLDIVENSKMIKDLSVRLAEVTGIGLDISSLSGGDTLNYGFIAYKKLWESFGIHSILSSKDIAGNIDYSLNANGTILSTLPFVSG